VNFSHIPKFEILGCETVLEIVHDGVGVVWAHLLKELLKVVRGRLCLMLAGAHSFRDEHHTRAVYSLVVATIVVGHGCGLLKSLLAALLATLGALPGVLCGNIGRFLPAAT
jgi:hypothetical protein